MKKLLTVLLAVLMVVTLSACTKQSDPSEFTVEYTYKSYSTSLGTGWNPHTWQTNGESSILGYITTPWVSMSIEDSENCVYQWTFLAATEITDVTAQHQDLLTKYAVNLPEGVSDASQVTEQFVYQIKLNKDLKWQNGEKINADTYVDSLKKLLDPNMHNYRANLTYAGDYALAGAHGYYFSTQEGYYVPFSSKYASAADAIAADDAPLVDIWYFWGAEGYTDAAGNTCPQYLPINDETVYGEAQGDAFTCADVWAAYGASYLDAGCDYEAVVWEENETMGVGFETVGFEKVDDYTVLWVSENQIDYNTFLYSQTSNWLVYAPMYEAGYDTTGELTTTDYCTTAENTMSYGPYVMTSYEADKQIVYTKNPYYYAFKKDSKSSRLVGTTSWLVDGKQVELYMTDRVIVDIMDDAAAKQAFLKGELTDWAPTAEDLPTYLMSDYLYKADETYTMTYFFNTDLDALKAMDTSYGNKNSVVLSNRNFRKGMSLAIDRAEYVTATQGYKVQFGLISGLYFYDVFNNPDSIYRNADPAKKAICDFYGIKFGAGEAYATLDDAYNSVTGYNLTEAKNCMVEAFKELAAEGIYTGGDIHIRVGYAKGAVDSAINQQCALLNKYVNAALEGSGFGKVEFEAVGQIPNRYSAVPAGEFAIGWGGWGGAVFDPFTKFEVFMDPDKYAGQVCEIACYDPTKETVTLNWLDKSDTMTWQAWSGSMAAGGKYSNASADEKLEILAALEKAFLEQYYDIPVCSTTAASMLSQQVQYYTKNYNIMYGFGGLELLTFNYTDTEWAKYVADQGGTLDYE